MLSFEEFRAVSKREQNKAQVANQQQESPKEVQGPSTPVADESKDVGAAKDDLPSFGRKMLGDFLELQSLQALYILLLVLDTFAALAEVSLAANPVARQLAPRMVAQTVRALKLFSKASLVVFSLEILLVYISFGLATVTHIGYMTDFLVITAQLALDLQGVGRANRLLNILRVWRPLRLLASQVQVEREEKESLQRTINEKNDELAAKANQIELLNVELSKEKNARESIEALLQNYKEEVDTLNEALKIAAMDIAEVAQTEDDLLSDEDDDQATLSSRADSSTQSKVSKLRAALDENLSSEASKPSTFVIHEDGRFERK